VPVVIEKVRSDVRSSPNNGHSWLRRLKARAQHQSCRTVQARRDLVRSGICTEGGAPDQSTRPVHDAPGWAP
jgi:hypothetical protein